MKQYSKIIRTVLQSGFLIILFLPKLFGQGTFQNLNFESAVIIPVPGDFYGRVQFSPALPGWTGTNGSSLETLALFNNMFLDSTSLGIQGPGGTLGLPRIAGNYTAMIQSGYALSGPPTQASASLSQTGLVPSGTASLQFLAAAYGPFQVALNDIPINVTAVQSFANYTLYGVNIPAYAGTTTKLTFTAIPYATQPIISSLFLDSIQFSNQLIPEPSILAIFGLGALLFSHRSRLARIS